MATFRVGQRIRLICYSELSDRIVPIGHEGIIVEVLPEVIRVKWPGYERQSKTGVWRAFAWQLAPLTDPGADAFIARLKRLGSEPVNDAPKVTVRAE